MRRQNYPIEYYQRLHYQNRQLMDRLDKRLANLRGQPFSPWRTPIYLQLSRIMEKVMERDERRFKKAGRRYARGYT